MAEEKKEEVVTKNKGDYALNTFKDIWKYDRARLLDLGNDFQVLMSQKDPDRNEEARARSNFEKLVEGERRPFSHTMTDATRLLPDVIALLAGAGVKAASKGISKLTGKVGEKAAKEATKGVAKKLVNEGTSEEALKLFNYSKLLPRDAKDMAGKAWVRNLKSDKFAMDRIAGRRLSDKEISAIGKNIDEFVPHRIDNYNAKIDELKELFKQLGIKGDTFKKRADLEDFLGKALDDGKITQSQYRDALYSTLELPPSGRPQLSFSHLNVDRIMEPNKEVKEVLSFKDVFNDVRDVARPILGNTLVKAADSAINDGIKTKFEAVGFPDGVIKPAYDYSGAEATPVKDFVLGMLDLDFNDPARFNEKDIEALMSVLKEKGYFEKIYNRYGEDTGRYVVDTWSPRQKISWLREQLSDKNKAEVVKNLWLNSDQRKELLGE